MIADRAPETSEALARIAHGVYSPFKEHTLYADSAEERMYFIHVRDVGERVAARVIFGYVEPPATNIELLERLIQSADRLEASARERFLHDEEAVIHAARIYFESVDEMSKRGAA